MLSQNDKTFDEPKHNTQAEIAKATLYRYRTGAGRHTASRAWEVVATFARSGVSPSDDAATEFVATATFTEGLLRSILPLNADQQVELVRRLDAGETQQAVADAIGWSREAVRNYASMAKIAKEAWAIVGTTIRDVVPSGEDGAVPEFGSGVPFSENLLRSILPLNADQQVDLVRRLARWDETHAPKRRIGFNGRNA